MQEEALIVLEPITANTKSFIWVTVAEPGKTFFACAGRADGMPDGPCAAARGSRTPLPR
ncbi:MAG TPA: hypothetical protein VFN21_06030 [Acidimicrobiales bacterium]|nr:hypothetical protein [Acidimicrobiales bacterium]